MPGQSTKTCLDCGTPLRGYYAKRCKSCATHLRYATERAAMTPPNPSGLCQCGCGKVTPIAKRSCRTYGYVGGEHKPYCNGHSARCSIAGRKEPNPAGLCMCGCGKPAPIARRTKGDAVRGKPQRFFPNHQTRARDEPDEYVADPQTGCWEWRLCLDKGYGRKKGIGAHRVLYEARKGPIPRGYHLHHKCENPRCVNPDHLEPMTMSDHMKLHHAMRRQSRASHDSDSDQ
jgi:hypothetical protein